MHEQGSRTIEVGPCRLERMKEQGPVWKDDTMVATGDLVLILDTISLSSALSFLLS